MPHKDLEVRRIYNRENARRYRAKNPAKLRLWMDRSNAKRKEAYNNDPQERMKVLAKNEAWRRRATEKVKAIDRRAWLKKRYGLTFFQYEELLKSQEGLCAICRKPPKSKDKPLYIDHDHNTRLVRGLLCAKCNHVIGLLETAGDLGKFFDYIKREVPQYVTSVTGAGGI